MLTIEVSHKQLLNFLLFNDMVVLKTARTVQLPSI